MPFTGGTAPRDTRLSTLASLITLSDRYFTAAFFWSSVAFAEIDQKFAGLPAMSAGSPLPPGTVGKVVQPSLLCANCGLACLIVGNAQEPIRYMAALLV